jgi:hypothetical protein
MRFLSTGRSQVRSVKCCVLFDPSDGAIHHVHRVVTMEGADETPEHLIEQRTLQLAKELGLEVTGLQLLHVDPHSLEPNKQYQVDLSRRCLVAVERPFGPEKTPGSRPSQCSK